MTVKLAIVYYSSYGTNHQMATIAADAAREAGAEVRLLKARETAPEEAINSQDAWKAHHEATADVPEATADDMKWANAYLISAGTRFGVMASQMRAFIDTLGGLWAYLGDDIRAECTWRSRNNAEFTLHDRDALGWICCGTGLHQ